LKIIDFTDIDLYPSRYWANFVRGSLVFTIRSLNIEDIFRQEVALMTKKTQLMIGDSIRIDTKFGHNTARAHEREHWIDVPLDGLFKVIDIIPRPELSEIELKVIAI